MKFRDLQFLVKLYQPTIKYQIAAKPAGLFLLPAIKQVHLKHSHAPSPALWLPSVTICLLQGGSQPMHTLHTSASYCWSEVVAAPITKPGPSPSPSGCALGRDNSAIPKVGPFPALPLPSLPLAFLSLSTSFCHRYPQIGPSPRPRVCPWRPEPLPPSMPSKACLSHIPLL